MFGAFPPAVHSGLQKPLGRVLRAHTSSFDTSVLNNHQVPGTALGAGEATMNSTVMQYVDCTPSRHRMESRAPSFMSEPSAELHVH